MLVNYGGMLQYFLTPRNQEIWIILFAYPLDIIEFEA